MSRLAFLLLLVYLAVTVLATDYFERLNLTPLPLGSLLASFEFRANESLEAYENQNFRYFPRSLGQVLQHANTKELHLRFTTGRWDTETWGPRPWNGTREGGTGVELWAWIESESDEDAFTNWITLNQGLSGLFCASMNFIDQTRTTKPVLSFIPWGDHSKRNGKLHLLHGVLPGEVVCTENLTPFLKLLPCKGKAGISSLLDGHKVFDASWQSMSIDMRPRCSTNDDCIIEINQSIDMVLSIERSKRPKDDPIPKPVPNEQLICDEEKRYHNQETCYPLDATSDPPWSLKDVFGRTLAGQCPLAEEEGPEAKSMCVHVPHRRMIWIGASGFEVRSAPGEPESRCYQFIPGEDFDFDVTRMTLEEEPEVLHELLIAERTMTGHGAATGGMRTVFTNPSAYKPVKFVYFESLPWFLRPYVHTLKAEVTKSGFPVKSEIIQEIFYRPAIDRKRGTQLEVVLTVPPASTVMMTYDLEKTILRYTEYPPDANRGFNVAPAVMKILDTPQEIYLRTTSLLLPLPTPDFSMPYNVIILTSTVIALAFGSIFNILGRRFVGVDELPENRLKALINTVRGRIVALKDGVKGKSAKTE